MEAEFEIKTGEIVGLLGRNGTGKSTLFNILSGTLKPDTIQLLSDGKFTADQSGLHNTFGYHTQQIMLPKTLQVRKLIEMYIDGGDDQNKIFYAPGVALMETKRIYELSHGQRRYLQFLLILNLRHKFILLDEPFSMVEPLYREVIKEKIIKAKNEKGIVITDHYYEDIFSIADRFSIIYNKKINNDLQINDEKIINNYLRSDFT